MRENRTKKKKKKNASINSIKNEKIKRKNKNDIFSKEYEKIIEYNKRKKNLYEKKIQKINIDNNYDNNDLKNIYANIHNKAARYNEFSGTSPTNQEDIIYNNQKPGNKKLYVFGNIKKNNFIPTTNYTNSESPGYTRLITFQGKGNNINSKPVSKGKY